MTVHPRACGEHQNRPVCLSGCRGSSPRLRGTPWMAGTSRPGLRFIPAPAGNTAQGRCRAACETVHPRACGEHDVPKDNPDYDAGSSPRLRGTRAAECNDEIERRFIPAPAGNTARNTLRNPDQSVHPRACGEHAPNIGATYPVGGSSPRLRGTQPGDNLDYSLDRFIPAPAGNTRRRFLQVLCGTVHPRACGEHAREPTLTDAALGSSPRLRGTRHGELPADPWLRFIPAPAGNTVTRSRQRRA